MISIKSVAQIDKMKRAGEIVALTHELMKKNICDGVTTKELDRIADILYNEGVLKKEQDNV